jgi:hypothetical protein
MRRPPKTPRTPAPGHDTRRTGLPDVTEALRTMREPPLASNAISEITHALGVDYAQYSRAQAEVIVDTTTLIVLSAVGLDTAGETVPYVAGWGESGALEAVTEFAAVIDTLARQIEAAIHAPGATQPSPANRQGVAA